MQQMPEKKEDLCAMEKLHNKEQLSMCQVTKSLKLLESFYAL